MSGFGLKDIAGIVSGIIKSGTVSFLDPTIQTIAIDSRTIADVHSCLFFVV